VPVVSWIALFSNVALLAVLACASANSPSASNSTSKTSPVSADISTPEVLFADAKNNFDVRLVSFAHPLKTNCLILNNTAENELTHGESYFAPTVINRDVKNLLSVEAKAERSNFSSAEVLGNTFANEQFDWEWIPVSVKAPETGVAEVHVLSA